ncbi:peptidoglycan-binding protein [Kocuria sp.]|uniref:peptidoglycan-binding protein n=1 Tax=Kocuria sp. TaxID=1871328 RepID=UPI0026E06E4F|nr:peptidoglycan-binding protein [Kocuria sp.]MDO5366427.1 peptidoglycan-binding protein [Kocuria sp.]
MTSEPHAANLRLGVTDRRVVGLRERLIRASEGATGLSPDAVKDPSHFDETLDGALRIFQQNKGLIVDGVLGPETETALTQAQYTLGDRPLFYDAEHPLRGEDVELIQANLSRLGFYYGHLNGVFCRKTHYAVVELQQNLGLEADGVVDLETIAALARINKNITSSKAYSLRDYHRLEQATNALKQRVIILLPWSTSGQAISPTAPEQFTADQERITTDVALRTYELLNNVGASPVILSTGSYMTRSGEPVRTVESKAAATQGHPDALVLTLHCDWNASESANGVATYYWGDQDGAETFSPIGETAARYILKELISRTGAQDLGCHARQWELLRYSNAPTVWIDLGYLSSAAERINLENPEHRERLAESILCALQRMYVRSADNIATGTMSLSDIEDYYNSN